MKYHLMSKINKNQVIIINGCGASGKDLFVSNAKEYLKVNTASEYGVLLNELPTSPQASSKTTDVWHRRKLINPVQIHNISSIDPVRNVAAELIGSDDFDKDDAYRTFLSEIKSAWVKYNNGPLNYILSEINRVISYNNETHVIFVHIRESLEIGKLVTALNDTDVSCTTLLIRGRVDPDTYSNVSDRDVESYDYDVTIDNSGTLEEFEKKTRSFMQHLFNL